MGCLASYLILLLLLFSPQFVNLIDPSQEKTEKQKLWKAHQNICFYVVPTLLTQPYR
jgi:hypothetical protein